MDSASVCNKLIARPASQNFATYKKKQTISKQTCNKTLLYSYK